jgi:F-type H+-transporting ATPase subunit epsilon
MSSGAVPFWRAAGMTYISYSNICANLVRNCLKEPFKTEALTREKVHFSISKWADGKPQKPSTFLLFLSPQIYAFFIRFSRFDHI